MMNNRRSVRRVTLGVGSVLLLAMLLSIALPQNVARAQGLTGSGKAPLRLFFHNAGRRLWVADADGLDGMLRSLAVAVATTTTLSCTPNPFTVGQSVTCTATVVESDPATPTGTVTFFMGGAPMAGCINVPLNASAQATCTMVPLSTCAMTATYGGDAKFAASTSGVFVEEVNAAAPAKPAEVPEADTLILFAGGAGGLATWLRFKWHKRARGDAATQT